MHTPARDCERPALSVRFRPRDVCGRGARGAIKAAPRAWRAPLPPEHSSATGGKKVCASLLPLAAGKKESVQWDACHPLQGVYIHTRHAPRRQPSAPPHRRRRSAMARGAAERARE